MLSFGYVRRDADVFTDFLRGIVMSYGAQESYDSIRTTNSKVADIVIRSCADCILKKCPHSRLVFRMKGVEKALERNRPFMGIEAMHTKRLVRYMMYLAGGEIRRPTADVCQALRLVEVSLLPPQFLCQ